MFKGLENIDGWIRERVVYSIMVYFVYIKSEKGIEKYGLFRNNFYDRREFF